MKVTPTKPYLIRAIYEWCVDNELTPYITVVIDQNASVPEEYVKGGEITLNISPLASHELLLGNDSIQFTTRFKSIPRKISIPISSVKAIFAKEINQGLFFMLEPEQKTSHLNEDTKQRESSLNHHTSQESGRDRDHLKIVR